MPDIALVQHESAIEGKVDAMVGSRKRRRIRSAEWLMMFLVEKSPSI
jgi:hypothetical protein